MKLIIYGLIYIIGTLFGSFFSLAVYRIPIKQSIMHGRSYCPKCNHRLNFLDLIPVFSYIFLGGKCRYCKEKIRIRYICLEILSGIVFLIFSLSLKIDLFNLEISKIIYLVFGILFISTLFLIGGIEKENHYISKPVLLFGLILEVIYIIYLYILKMNRYKYAIYLFIMCALLVFNNLLFKKRKQVTYIIDILILYLFIAIFVKEELVILSITLVTILSLLKYIQNKKIPVGFYICCINIVMMITQSFICSYFK